MKELKFFMTALCMVLFFFALGWLVPPASSAAAASEEPAFAVRTGETYTAYDSFDGALLHAFEMGGVKTVYIVKEAALLLSDPITVRENVAVRGISCSRQDGEEIWTETTSELGRAEGYSGKLFEVEQGASLTLSYLTVNGGQAVEAAVCVKGTFTLGDNASIRSAVNTGGKGGAIYAAAGSSVTLVGNRASVTGCSASDGAVSVEEGAAFTLGGAVRLSGTGHLLYAYGGTVTVTDSAVITGGDLALGGTAVLDLTDYVGSAFSVTTFGRADGTVARRDAREGDVPLEDLVHLAIPEVSEDIFPDAAYKTRYVRTMSANGVEEIGFGSYGVSVAQVPADGENGLSFAVRFTDPVETARLCLGDSKIDLSPKDGAFCAEAELPATGNSVASWGVELGYGKFLVGTPLSFIRIDRARGSYTMPEGEVFYFALSGEQKPAEGGLLPEDLAIENGTARFVIDGSVRSVAVGERAEFPQDGWGGTLYDAYNREQSATLEIFAEEGFEYTLKGENGYLLNGSGGIRWLDLASSDKEGRIRFVDLDVRAEGAQYDLVVRVPARGDKLPSISRVVGTFRTLTPTENTAHSTFGNRYTDYINAEQTGTYTPPADLLETLALYASGTGFSDALRALPHIKELRAELVEGLPAAFFREWEKDHAAVLGITVNSENLAEAKAAIRAAAEACLGLEEHIEALAGQTLSAEELSKTQQRAAALLEEDRTKLLSQTHAVAEVELENGRIYALEHFDLLDDGATKALDALKEKLTERIRAVDLDGLDSLDDLVEIGRAFFLVRAYFELHRIDGKFTDFLSELEETALPKAMSAVEASEAGKRQTAAYEAMLELYRDHAGAVMASYMTEGFESLLEGERARVAAVKFPAEWEPDKQPLFGCEAQIDEILLQAEVKFEVHTYYNELFAREGLNAGALKDRSPLEAVLRETFSAIEDAEGEEARSKAALEGKLALFKKLASLLLRERYEDEGYTGEALEALLSGALSAIELTELGEGGLSAAEEKIEDLYGSGIFKLALRAYYEQLREDKGEELVPGEEVLNASYTAIDEAPMSEKEGVATQAMFELYRAYAHLAVQAAVEDRSAQGKAIGEDVERKLTAYAWEGALSETAALDLLIMENELRLAVLGEKETLAADQRLSGTMGAEALEAVYEEYAGSAGHVASAGTAAEKEAASLTGRLELYETFTCALLDRFVAETFSDRTDARLESLRPLFEGGKTAVDAVAFSSDPSEEALADCKKAIDAIAASWRWRPVLADYFFASVEEGAYAHAHAESAELRKTLEEGYAAIDAAPMSETEPYDSAKEKAAYDGMLAILKQYSALELSILSTTYAPAGEALAFYEKIAEDLASLAFEGAASAVQMPGLEQTALSLIAYCDRGIRFLQYADTLVGLEESGQSSLAAKARELLDGLAESEDGFNSSRETLFETFRTLVDEELGAAIAAYESRAEAFTASRLGEIAWSALREDLEAYKTDVLLPQLAFEAEQNDAHALHLLLARAFVCAVAEEYAALFETTADTDPLTDCEEAALNDTMFDVLLAVLKDAKQAEAEALDEFAAATKEKLGALSYGEGARSDAALAALEEAAETELLHGREKQALHEFYREFSASQGSTEEEVLASCDAAIDGGATSEEGVKKLAEHALETFASRYGVAGTALEEAKNSISTETAATMSETVREIQLAWLTAYATTQFAEYRVEGGMEAVDALLAASEEAFEDAKETGSVYAIAAAADGILAATASRLVGVYCDILIEQSPALAEELAAERDRLVAASPDTADKAHACVFDLLTSYLNAALEALAEDGDAASTAEVIQTAKGETAALLKKPQNARDADFLAAALPAIETFLAQAEVRVAADRLLAKAGYTERDFSALTGEDLAVRERTKAAYDAAPDGVKTQLDGTMSGNYADFSERLADECGKASFEAERGRLLASLTLEEGGDLAAAAALAAKEALEKLTYAPAYEREETHEALMEELAETGRTGQTAVRVAICRETAIAAIEAAREEATSRNVIYSESGREALDGIVAHGKEQVLAVTPASSGSVEERVAAANAAIEAAAKSAREALLASPVIEVHTADGIEVIIENEGGMSGNALPSAEESEDLPALEGLGDLEIKAAFEVNLLGETYRGTYLVKLKLASRFADVASLTVVGLRDGRAERLVTRIEGEYLVFETTHFSAFYVCGERVANMWWLLFILIFVLLVELVLIVILGARVYRKLNASREVLASLTLPLLTVLIPSGTVIASIVLGVLIVLAAIAVAVLLMILYRDPKEDAQEEAPEAGSTAGSEEAPEAEPSMGSEEAPEAEPSCDAEEAEETDAEEADKDPETAPEEDLAFAEEIIYVETPSDEESTPEEGPENSEEDTIEATHVCDSPAEEELPEATEESCELTEENFEEDSEEEDFKRESASEDGEETAENQQIPTAEQGPMSAEDIAARPIAESEQLTIFELEEPSAEQLTIFDSPLNEASPSKAVRAKVRHEYVFEDEEDIASPEAGQSFETPAFPVVLEPLDLDFTAEDFELPIEEDLGEIFTAEEEPVIEESEEETPAEEVEEESFVEEAEEAPAEEEPVIEESEEETPAEEVEEASAEEAEEEAVEEAPAEEVEEEPVIEEAEETPAEEESEPTVEEEPVVEEVEEAPAEESTVEEVPAEEEPVIEESEEKIPAEEAEEAPAEEVEEEPVVEEIEEAPAEEAEEESVVEETEEEAVEESTVEEVPVEEAEKELTEEAKEEPVVEESTPVVEKAEEEVPATEETEPVIEEAESVPEEEASVAEEQEPAEEKPVREAVEAPEEYRVAPESLREEVAASEVNALMRDDVAKTLIEESVRTADRSKTGIVNVDTLGEYFENGEKVTLEELKKRVPYFNKKVTYVKILARGRLSKALTVEGDDFSLEAVKMIALTGGHVIRTRRK